MEADELHALALEVCILGALIAKVARESLEARLSAHGVGLRPLPYGVLRLLAHQELTLSELSRQLYVRPATLVPVVDALERDGLIRRRQDPADRRRAPLVLSEGGAELLALVPATDATDPVAQAVQAMDPAQAWELLSLLRGLVGRLPAGEDITRQVAARVRLLLAQRPG